MGLEDAQNFYKMQKRKMCVGRWCERAGGGEIHNEFTWGLKGGGVGGEGGCRVSRMFTSYT